LRRDCFNYGASDLRCVSCFNVVRDNVESCVDGGGTHCARRCTVGERCLVGSDCGTGLCNVTATNAFFPAGTCRPPTQCERCESGAARSQIPFTNFANFRTDFDNFETLFFFDHFFVTADGGGRVRLQLRRVRAGVSNR
jgi:hypothetical protein